MNSKLFSSISIVLVLFCLAAQLAQAQNLSNTGTITNSTGTAKLVVKGTVSFGSQTSIGGIVEYAKAGPSQTIATIEYTHLTLSGGAGSTKTFPNAEVKVDGDLTLSGGVVKADVNARPNTSAKITYFGAGGQNVASLDYQNIEFATSGLKSFAAGTTKIAGSFTMSGTATADATTAATTIEYDGSGAQSLAAINYDALSITGTRTGTPAITLASGTIGIKSAFTVSPTGAVTYTTTGNAVNYNGTGGQTVAAFDYNDLTLSNTRTGANNVTLASAGTVGISGTFNPNVTFGTGGYVVTGSTVHYKGASGQSVIGGTSFPLYENLTVSGLATDVKAASGNIALNAAGVLNNSAILNMTDKTLTFTAGPTNTGTVQFSAAGNGKAVGSTSGTVEFNGSIAQTVTAETYFNIKFTGGSAGARKTIAGVTQASGAVTVDNATAGYVSVSGTLNVVGDLTNGGDITNSGTITVGF